MRMRQYICHTDHNLWDIIINGNLEDEATPSGEQSSPLVPKIAKQLAAKRNQERIKSILLLAIPDEYLLKFHNVPDAIQTKYIRWLKLFMLYIKLLELGMRYSLLSCWRMVLEEVKQQPDGIFISQDNYVADILKKFDFCSIKIATTPIKSNKPLVKDEDGVEVDVHEYRSMFGSLMYLTTSRPDIMFAVCACARDSPFELEAFSYSDYAGASLDRKSITGGCQFLGRRLISWQCKKQTTVTNSTTEIEYVAAAH
ncbi:hypothetical protein Tco_0144126 [Tanacetum coccineum]